MTKINSQASGLGTVTVFGPRHPDDQHQDEALWVLTGYTPRIQPETGKTPGSHGIRVLAVRNDPREMKFAFSDHSKPTAQFADPMLLDLLLQRQGNKGGKFALEISGLALKTLLVADTRVTVSPVWEHPDTDSHIADINAANYVPAYFLQAGAIPLDSSTLMPTLLPGLDKTQPVLLTAEGIIYSALVPPPGGGEAISTRLRLGYRDKVLCLTFDDPQPAAAWNEVWRRLNAIAGSSSATQWGRFSFNTTPQIPQLSWRITVQGNALKVNWAEAIVPREATLVTLADQKPENRKMPPMAVMRLTSEIALQYADETLTIKSLGSPVQDPQATWQWRDNSEGMQFSRIPLVHDASSVRERLFSQYGDVGADDKTAVGFLLLDDGWAEIPFTADKHRLPGIVFPENVSDVSGSFWLGNRRRERFNSRDKAALCAPWSLLFDEPKNYTFEFIFSIQPGSATLQSATVTLEGSAMTLRGGVWLAATAPDGHDALPCVSDDPASFFDLLLRRCEGDASAAPFVLEPFTVEPEKQPDLSITVNTDVTAAKGASWRVWLRHPTLPGIQVLPVTRSDTRSSRPHASRSLTPFDAQGGALQLEDMLSMMPGMSASTRKRVEISKPIMPLVALTLPGLELTATAADAYDVKGYYTLPLWDDPHACAVLPLPDNAIQTIPPVITALMPEALKQATADNLLRRANAATLHSEMFTAAGVMAKNLYPPYDWNPTVTFSDKVSVTDGRVTWGAITMTDGNWIWHPDSNELLEGPREMLTLKDNQVSINGSGKKNLTGWSVSEEESSPGVIQDGLGVFWRQKPQTVHGLIAREIQFVDPSETLWLLSTQQPLSVSGVNGILWDFTFTDVPVSAQRNDIARPDGTVQKEGWTWSLSDPRTLGDDIALFPLSLGPNLRFMPTALISLSRTLSGGVSAAKIEGTLLAGEKANPLALDTLHRVAVTLTGSEGDTLKVSSINPVSGEFITWDLSGGSQLTGRLALSNGSLWLEQPHLALPIFSVEKTLQFDPIDTTQAEATSNLANGLQASINLQTASVLWTTLTTPLRDGVRVTLSLTQTPEDNSAKLNWFGNEIPCQAVIDAARRSCVLTPDKVEGLVVIAGMATANLLKGTLALSFSEAELELQTYFLELEMELGTLRVTHLLHVVGKKDVMDSLRLDGRWTRTSLVEWPALAPVDDTLAQASLEIDFATPAKVIHEATFVLTDHCLSGSQFRPAAGKGIGLSAETASWLVDTRHRFTSQGKTRQLRCLGVLQLRSAAALADELDAKWSTNSDLRGYGFTPGYIGMKTDGHTAQFLRPGVRRLSHGYTGLLDPQVVQGLHQEQNADAWLLLGGMTALYNRRDDLYGLLHLPFIATSAGGDSLAAVLKVTSNSPQTKLNMVRHDLLSMSLKLAGARLQSPSELIRQPFRRAVPFTCDLGNPTPVGGSELAKNWFSDESVSLIPGWHVEQIQRAGATPASDASPAPLPFVFPRSAIMLAMLFNTDEPTDSLSLLTSTYRRQANIPGAQPMTVRRALIRLSSSVDSVPPPAVTDMHSDLIVGGPSGLVAVPLSRTDIAIDDVKHFIALAAARMAEPTFILRRDAQGYLAYVLPTRDEDPLERPVRPLSRLSSNPPDGRLSWPMLAEVDKMATEVLVSPRSSRCYDRPLAMSGIRSEIQTRAPSGKPFQLTTSVNSQEKTETVWIQEWEQVAFQNRQPTDTAAVAARPTVPSASEIARALLQMDPTLPATRLIQTRLPPAAMNLDFATRAGAFVTMGVRGLHSVNKVHSQNEPAETSLSTMRSIRRPRPTPLPENSGDSASWRQTVAWYGNKNTTCMALAGAWDIITAPLVDDIPQWVLLMGRPEPSGLIPDSAGRILTWRGAITVKCMMWDKDNQPLERPARLLLDMMHRTSSLHCRLRVGTEMCDFSAVEFKADDTLRFTLERSEGIEETTCTFEFRILPLTDVEHEPPYNTDKLLLTRTSTGNDTLEPAAMRSLTLPVLAPVRDRYPFPLLRRTIIFADPALDQVLSQTNPIIVDSGAKGDFNVWLDNATITPTATLVIQVRSEKEGSFTLNAAVIRHESGKQETLAFTLPDETKPLESVRLEANEVYTLPTARFSTTLHAEDTLILTIVRGEGTARVAIAIKALSTQTPPPAMYSLIVTDPKNQKAWCAAHSASPAPESLWVEMPHQEKLLRRGVFKWVAYTSTATPSLGWSILKAERSTESTCIPLILERELSIKQDPDA
ncbi:MAG TPA: hypothetical protein VGI71_05795 [Scandinavium sp.]|jgi:hypothetical protein